MKKVTLLTVDDDSAICELIKLYAELEGYDVCVAYNGEEALNIMYERLPDIVLVDVMMPVMDGWTFCQEVRRHFTTPIILITGRGEPLDKMKGFSLDIDDYVVKPFDPSEVMARVKAVLRRVNPAVFREPVLEIANTSIHLAQQEVVVAGEKVSLAPKEMEVLYFLACNRKQVFTRYQLIEQIWGIDFDGDERTIDVHIKRIREKLRLACSDWSVETVRGIGYKFGMVSRHES